MSVSPPLPIQVAALLMADGRPDEAAARLEAITRETPTYAAAHVLHATALESAGDPEAALDAWGRAAALVPLSPLVHRQRERLMAALWVPDDDDEELPPAVPAPAGGGLGAALDGLLEGLDARDAGPASEPDDEDPDVEHVLADLGVPAADVAPDPAELLPPEEGGPDPMTVVPEAVDGDDGGGWRILDEAPIPSPPRPSVVEPDVVSPGRPAPGGAPPRPIADELDVLIERLDDAPRIKPDPAYDGPAETLDAGDLTTVYSETLADIYAAQGQWAQAAEVCESLARRRPESAAHLRQKAAAFRARA